MDEAPRHRLYIQLEQTLGPDATSTMMSLLPPVGWADVATKDDLRTLETSLRGEMGGLRHELLGEMSELRGDVTREIASLGSRLTTALRQQLFAIVAAMLTVAALTVAAASIL